MKRNVLFLTFAVTVVCCLLVSCKKEDIVKGKELRTLKDSVSCAYGYVSGLQAHQSDRLELNADLFAKAFKQGYGEDSAAIFSQEECFAILEKYARQKQEVLQQTTRKKAARNIEAAENFLKQNSKNKGVKTTVSGLQYKVLTQGQGVKPQSGRGDRIKFLYSMSILDDKGQMHEIYSDYDNPRSQAQLMGIDNFIKGFTEGVEMMNKGSHYLLWIHPDLAYGMDDSPEIPAGSLLMYDIKVVDVIASE